MGVGFSLELMRLRKGGGMAEFIDERCQRLTADG
jgi:hypothetical protein